MTVARSLVDLEDGPSINLSLLEVGLESSSFRRGGLNRYFTHLVRSLDQIGLPVRAITMGQEGPADKEAGRDVVVPVRGSILRRLAAIRSAGREEMASADIVDAHFALTALPFITGLLRHRPLVIHFQGPWADESAATGQSVVVCGLKRLVESVVYKRASAFVVLSQSFRRLLIERYGVSPWKIEVIHPGVDLDHFKPGDKEAARARLGLPADGPVVVTVRRLVPRMGLDVMVEAWAKATSNAGLRCPLARGGRWSQPRLPRSPGGRTAHGRSRPLHRRSGRGSPRGVLPSRRPVGCPLRETRGIRALHPGVPRVWDSCGGVGRGWTA